MYRSFTTAAALLAFLPSTLAVGTAYVISNCDFDVYYASVSQNVGAPMQKLPAGGYSESYDMPNDGISIKISTSPSGPVTQFEFTWDSPNINYDISHINGNPFEAYGESLVPSQAGASGYPSCVALSCPAGTSTCNDAYNQPDDIQTRVCPESSDLTFTLCPGGSASNPPSVSSAKGSAAASSAVVASSVFSQPAFSVPAASPSSQPAFSKTTAVPVSQPGYSAPAASESSQPAYFSFSHGEFSRTAAVQASTTVAAVPTSFQTSTTPAAKQPAETSIQAQSSAPAAPIASQNSPVAAATTPAAQAPAASTPAAAASPTHSWSWGNWGGNWGGHQHVRRVHSHHFRL